MKNQILWTKLVLLVLIKTIRMEPQWHDAADGQRYLIDTEEKYNWYQAWNECARYDAQLLVIENEMKYENIKKLLKTLNDKNKYLWIGGNVLYEKISFYWAPSEQLFTFTNWQTDDVGLSTFKKQCVYLMRHRKNFPWNFVTCDAKQYGFICEEMPYDTTESLEKTGDISAVENDNKGAMYNGSIYGLIG